jgi:hypothetical protein
VQFPIQTQDGRSLLVQLRRYEVIEPAHSAAVSRNLMIVVVAQNA